jgi:hypothetical protein
MMTFTQRLRRLWSDETGCISLGAAIALALIPAGAQTATSIYQSKKAGDLNEKALRMQDEESRRAVDLEREEAQRRERAYRDAMDIYQRQYSDYMSMMAPHWQYGDSVLRSLYGGGGSASAPPPPTSGVPAAGPASAPAMDLRALVSGPAPAGAAPAGGAAPAARSISLPAPMPQGTPQGGMSLIDLAQLAMAARKRSPTPQQQTASLVPLTSLVTMPS